jgi:hypothetical protein
LNSVVFDDVDDGFGLILSRVRSLELFDCYEDLNKKYKLSIRPNSVFRRGDRFKFKEGFLSQTLMD